MAQRRSSMIKRVTRIQGLDPDEKDIFLTVAEIADAAINNRTPSNPSNLGRAKISRIPPVKNLQAKAGVRSVQLEWTAINSANLLNYSINITHLDTGVTERKTTFTNNFVYKGRIGGNYKATVKAVARDGTSSLIQDIQFIIQGDVMLLEGAKNSFDVVGIEVSEGYCFSSRT